MIAGAIVPAIFMRFFNISAIRRLTGSSYVWSSSYPLNLFTNFSVKQESAIVSNIVTLSQITIILPAIMNDGLQFAVGVR